MAAQAAYAAEKAIGHGPEFIKQDVADYTGKGEGSATETMKALTWQGKQRVEVGMHTCLPQCPWLPCSARTNPASSPS